MKKLTRTLMIWALMLPTLAWAHDPDQISYHFAKSEDAGTLTVHFTPKSALDLLLSLHTEFDENAVIRLADYEEDFTRYFNETILLQVGEKKIGFSFREAAFGGHDASISFSLTGFEGSFDDLNINVSSFTEIYKRTSNHLFFPDQEEIVLNLANQRYSTLSPVTAKYGSLMSPVSMMLSVIALALIVGLSSRSLKKKAKITVKVNR
ncbi:MAG: hypothetical protein Roseis2KO_39810 [Roseivirga sp.]